MPTPPTAPPPSAPTPTRSIGIALIGCGNVGSGVLHILRHQGDLIRSRTGLSFILRHIVVRDPAKTRDLALPPGANIHSNLHQALSDPQVDVVLELIGGTGTAYDIATAALSAGKPLVTANKALLAEKGTELFALARAKRTGIGFEASAAGGIPVLNALTTGLVANRIDALVGIVNGTCNFILTQMTKHNAPYASALAEAQKLGFAEADPTMDVSGRDAAQKLALLASLAFDTHATESDIDIQGIDTLDAADIQYASELGYTIKLLALAERKQVSQEHPEGSLSLRVAPTLVPKSDVLADVAGSFNAVSIYGSATGHTFYYGRGAGSLPTASAVVSDLVQTALGLPQLAQSQTAIFSPPATPTPKLPIESLHARHYLRLTVKDQPGVLAAITQTLGQHQISIASVLQHESPLNTTSGAVPLVITTHHASEGAMRQALAILAKRSEVTATPACLRLLDTPKEFGA